MKNKVLFILVIALLLVVPIAHAADPDLAVLTGDLGCCCASNVESYDIVEELFCTEFPWTVLPPEFQPGGVNDDSTLQNEYCTATCPDVIDNPPTTETYEISGKLYNGTGTANPLTNAIAYLNIQGTTTASTTDSTGYFSIINVPAQNAVLYLTHPSCTTQLYSFGVAQDNNTDHNLDCSAANCVVSPVDLANPAFQVVSGALAFAAFPNQVSPALCSPESVKLKVCLDASGNDCKYVSWNDPQDALNGLPAEFDLGNNGFGQDGGWISEDQIELHVWISTKFVGSPDEVLSQKGTFPLGDVDCYYQSGSFCQDNIRLTCGGELGTVLQSPDPCPANTYCFDSGTTLECRDQIPCEECNSITNSFADIFSIFTPNFPFPEISCRDARTGGGQLPSSCALVATETSRNTFERCENINSCYDYTSELSCEGGNSNPCGVSGGCEWIDAEPSILGKGICKPQNQNLDCTECSTQFPEACDESFCNGLSDGVIECSLANRGGVDICLSTDLLSCQDYQTQDDCIGVSRTESLYNILYSSPTPLEDELPLGGNNFHTQPSNDTYEIGACRWDTVENSCYKDSDNNRLPDTCGSSSGGLNFLFLQCLIDVEPPVTTLFVEPNSVMDLQDLIVLNYVVEDNIFSSIGIDTFFCLEGGSLPFCDYPNASLDSLRVADTGTYLLKFFSRDNSGNHEVIQEVPVFLENVTIPKITAIRWEPK